jgi:hypothetical protein
MRSKLYQPVEKVKLDPSFINESMRSVVSFMNAFTALLDAQLP